MRFALDTEFNESQGSIILISIGIKAEDGREYYAVSSDFKEADCNNWVKDNVLPRLANTERISNKQIADEIVKFVGENPEFWGYYCDYDWVVFCWLYGCMIDLPDGFPMYCHDLKQEIDRLNLEISQPENSAIHNALMDAIWIAKTCRFIGAWR